MGYTHYWSFHKVKGVTASEQEAQYQAALLDIGKFARYWNKKMKGEGADESRLSGYTAHTKPGEYGGVQLNGKGDNGHEPFILREHLNQNEGEGFCKTAQKPYDTMVTAALAILKAHLGQGITITTDGAPSDWVKGVVLAHLYLKNKSITFPCSGWRETAAA